MTSAELENLVRLGQLRREPPVALEIGGLLRSGEARLTDAANRALHTLGLPPATWRVLSKDHETRNMAEYEGALDVDEGLVDDLIKAAEAVRGALRAADLPPGV